MNKKFRKYKPLVLFKLFGKNVLDEPILRVECRCGWFHMTSYTGDLIRSFDYLKVRWYDHYTSDAHKEL